MENPVAVEKDIIIKCSLEEMIKAFFKEYVIVWHDPNVNCMENQEYIDHLKKFCDVFTFTHWERARDCVHQAKVSCHVITSGRNGELLVKEIYLTENVENIYVFCGDKEYHSNWAKGYSKVSCIEDQIKTILSQIQQNLLKWYQKGSSLKSDLPAIAPLFNGHDKSAMNHRHRFLKVIPKFKNREQAKKDFLALSKGVYSDTSQTKFIEDFEKSYNEYNKEQILRWYTKESFLHKVTNNCLRISTSDSIQYSRLLICDIEKAIKEQYQTKTKEFSGLLYRAASLSEKEWVNLKENKGREIEMRGFLSVSKARDIAENYFYFSSGQMIFITIIVPKGLNEEEQGFAEVEEYSQFSHEKEVLFNIRSRFTILETEDKYSQEFPYRHLVLLYGAQGFRKFIAEQNPLREVSIPGIQSFSCAHCKIQVLKVPERIFLKSLRDGQEQYYCQECIGEKKIRDFGPFLCIPIMNTTKKFETKIIKGCLLINSAKIEIPFYGYKCEKCQAEKQKQYFTCADCDEREKKWCQNCFGLNLTCMHAGHSVILETSPFSFWCEKMSKNEASHLKFHNDFLPKDEDIFQQAEMYVESHEYTKAIEYYNLYIQENEAKGEEGGLATAYNNIGKVFSHRGEVTKAFRFYLKSLNMRKSVYGGDNHPDVAVSYGNIGLLYNNQRQHEKALESYLKSLEIRKSVYEDINHEIADFYHNIGLLYANQREHKKAFQYHLKSLDIRKSFYGDNHPDVASSYNGIGTVRYFQGEYENALKYYLKSLEIRKSIYGDNHPDVADSYQNIGNAYFLQGEYEKALEYHLTSLEIRKSVYEDIHHNVADSYHNIGLLYANQREHRKALEYHLKCLDIRKSVYGDNHPDVALSYNSIGMLYYNQREYENALEYYLKCLDIVKSVYGDNHPDVADSCNNIGNVHYRQREYEKALEYYLKSLEIGKSTYGDNHNDVAVTYSNIGNAYKNQDEYEKALECHLKSLDIRKSVYGENHPDVAHSYNSIGLLYYNQRECENALEYYLKCLDIVKSVYGDNHPNVAVSYHNIGNAHFPLDEYEKALECHLKSLEIRKSVYGERHADVALSYYTIGDEYFRQNGFPMAREYFLKCLEIYKSLYGDNHPQAIEVSDKIHKINSMNQN